MTWVLWGVTAVLVAVVILLAIPIKLSVRVVRTDRTRVTWQARWLFGVVRFGSRDAGTDTDSGDVSSPTRSAPRPTRARRRRRGGSRAAIAVLRTPGLVPRALRLVPGLLRQIQWGHVSVNAAFGFEDPATTGRTYGAIAPLLVAGGARGWPVRCQPVFGRECLEGTCAAALRVRPISLVGRVLAFLFSKPVFHAVRAWRAHR